MLSGNFINKFIIGTAQLSHNYGLKPITSFEKEKYLEIFKLAENKKINKIDTAQIYNNEKILKKIIKKNIVTTKFNYNYELSINQNFDFLSNHLKLLNISKVENILIHNFKLDVIDKFNILNKFGDLLKQKDLCENYGLSLYYNENLLDATIRNLHIDLIQIPVNIFDQRFAKSNYPEFFKNKNVLIQARSIYLQGLLLDEKLYNQYKFSKWSKIFEIYNNWLLNNNIKSIQACVSYIYSLNFVDQIVVGLNNIENLRSLLNIKIIDKLDYPLFTNDDNLLNPSKW